MSSTTLVRWSGLALMFGGLLAAMGTLLVVESTNNPSDPMWRPAGLLGMAGWTLLLLGLPYLYGRQVHAAGKLGLVSFVLFFIAGLLVGIGQNTDLALVVPWLASNPVTRPVVAEGTPALDIFFIVGELLLVVSVIFFGIATLRARVFPRWAGLLLIGSAVLRISGLALPLPAFIASIGTVLLFAALAWLGYTLRSYRDAGVMQPAFATPTAVSEQA